MNKEQQETYERVYKDFLSGVVTEKQWVEYCHHLLDILLEENKDVLYRLKYNSITEEFLSVQPIGKECAGLWRPTDESSNQ